MWVIAGMRQNSIKSGLPVIGVTGITGSGTSSVAEILAERGGFVVHADKLAHETMIKGEAAYIEIVEAFGCGILSEKGEINRRALGAKVFGSKSELAKLERIIHPRVIERTKVLVEKLARASTYSFAVIDAPLLIESGMHTMCDSIWLITATNELRTARIIARDEITGEAVKRRLASRINEEKLRSHAMIIIENNGSEIALRSKVGVALKGMELNAHGWVGCKSVVL